MAVEHPGGILCRLLASPRDRADEAVLAHQLQRFDLTARRTYVVVLPTETVARAAGALAARIDRDDPRTNPGATAYFAHMP